MSDIQDGEDGIDLTRMKSFLVENVSVAASLRSGYIVEPEKGICDHRNRRLGREGGIR